MVDNADVNRVGFRKDKRFKGRRTDTTAEYSWNQTRDGDTLLVGSENSGNEA